MSTIKVIGNPNQLYITRNTSYTADAYGVISISSPPPFTDVLDLMNSGCTPIGSTGGRSNWTATTDPGLSNDNTQDYATGSRWLNTTTGVEWLAISVGTGAAVWVSLIGSGLLLGRLIGANMNATTDQAFVSTGWSALNKFRITKITAEGASISLTTAAGGIYPAASKGGTAIVASSQAYSALTAATIALDLTLAAGTTIYAAGVTPYLSLTTAQGAAATASLYLFGDIYS